MQLANIAVADTGKGKKFSTEGKPQLFPGNTILCHLDSNTSEVMANLVNELTALYGTKCITWLPKSSYHVTLFDVSLDARRNRVDWPADLSLNATMEECNFHIIEKLKSFDLGFQLPIKMVADESVKVPTITMIPLKPLDLNEEIRLRNLRDRLSSFLGIRHSNHDSYNFHSTFGYYVHEFSEIELNSYQKSLSSLILNFKKQQPIIELGAAEFCVFKDMTKFEKQLLINKID